MEETTPIQKSPAGLLPRSVFCTRPRARGETTVPVRDVHSAEGGPHQGPVSRLDETGWLNLCALPLTQNSRASAPPPLSRNRDRDPNVRLAPSLLLSFCSLLSVSVAPRPVYQL